MKNRWQEETHVRFCAAVLIKPLDCEECAFDMFCEEERDCGYLVQASLFRFFRTAIVNRRSGKIYFGSGLTAAESRREAMKKLPARAKIKIPA